jgi:hypothetical protein
MSRASWRCAGHDDLVEVGRVGVRVVQQRAAAAWGNIRKKQYQVSMIMKTFFLTKIIHRISIRSLRNKKSLPENLIRYRAFFVLRAARCLRDFAGPGTRAAEVWLRRPRWPSRPSPGVADQFAGPGVPTRCRTAPRPGRGRETGRGWRAGPGYRTAARTAPGRAGRR